MKRHIPNIISASRIVLATVLLVTAPLTVPFYIVYLLCGLSDIADGFLAKRLNAVSTAGAVLDSAGDIVFMAAALIKLLPVVNIKKAIVIWIIGIFGVKLISAATGFFKYKKLVLLHTYLNKLTGAALFAFPLLYRANISTKLLAAVCALASLSAAEELIINLTSKTLNLDIKGIFIKTKDKA